MYESRSGADNSGPGLVDEIVQLLGAGVGGLITDVDGTVAPIVADPEKAVVLAGAIEALGRLKDEIELVAVVSGRQVRDARRMVGLAGITYVGNHGLEVLGPNGPEVVPEARPWVPRLARVLDDVQNQITREGVLIENKGVTASLHYRAAKEPERARRELLEILARSALTSGLRLEEGRMVLNLLPPLTVTKGSAVNWLAREHHLDRLVYLGDDITDAHAFKALTALRESGSMATLSIGVVGPETPLSVRQLADRTVPSVQAVADLLCAAAIGLRASGTMEKRRVHGRAGESA